MNILVTGANGQLGHECRSLSLQFPSANFVFTDMDELSISDESAVDAIFKSNQFQYCINAAAYTAVDLAETQQEISRLVNATAVGYLAKACATYGCRLIHISTDYVFDGEKAAGYQPHDPTGPINVYGATKLEGEQLAMRYAPDSIIIRTSWVYSFHGKNFVKTMMKLMQERNEICVVSDQTGRPTYAADLAACVFHIIFNCVTPQGGLYHYANEGAINWFEFATAIKEIGGYDCIIHPIPSSAYPVPAKRPRYSILNTQQTCNTFGLVIPDWKSSLIKCMQLLQASTH